MEAMSRFSGNFDNLMSMDTQDEKFKGKVMGVSL
jgi:hypothetical protein